MRIGYHVKERYVQRVLKMGHLDQQQMSTYISSKLDEIDRAITEMYEQSSFIFRKLYCKEGTFDTSMRAYYYHESGLIIVKDEQTDGLVTMFEPMLASIPFGLRSKEVIAGMASTIAQQFQQLESLYEKLSQKTEDLTTRREILFNQIEQMKAEMQQIDTELNTAFKPYELAEQKVLEMGAFLIDNRGRSQDEDAEVTAG